MQAHGVVLISVFVALSHTPSYAVRPWTWD